VEQPETQGLLQPKEGDGLLPREVNVLDLAGEKNPSMTACSSVRLLKLGRTSREEQESGEGAGGGRGKKENYLQTQLVHVLPGKILEWARAGG
jgi:hypothetical protein